MKTEAALQALLHVMDEGIHIVDRDGVTIYYNEQAGRNDGLMPDEVIGRHLLEVFPSLSAETSTLLKVLQTGRPVQEQPQTFANYKGNRITTLNASWPIFEDGKLVGAVEVAKDFTRVRELSEQVVDLQAELLGKRKRRVGAAGESRYSLQDLIGEHPAIEAVKEQVRRAARSASAVLLYGETGTGKEIVVHAIHQTSERRQKPLVAQNCAAMPEGLLESLLFGTVKGAFTGAEDRPGLFELADGGTLYLDEINSMNRELQAKLLRVLQDGKIRRVGEAVERTVDVRVIASANEDPARLVAEGRMRQDLYYRLNVVYIELPPLRERGGDIPLLVEHFLLRHGAPSVQVAPELIGFFERYTWPGNVRELEHALEAALQMAAGPELTLADLPLHLQRAATGRTLGIGAPRRERPPLQPTEAEEGQGLLLRSAVKDLEREAIQQALSAAKGNLSQAAAILGLPRQTLQYRVKKLGLRSKE
ncbi:MAG TPA: sigma 54-interacting transcriptional regulator [Symbiobacteriaceae bacterium]|nr:sigma 54-interacting transcriptional regulator [Symbiobacteriaceae bacterium]